jgi:hypothetical protein
MRTIHVLCLLAVICLAMFPSTVLAQMRGRPSRPGGYGGYGGYGDDGGIIDAGVLGLYSSNMYQASMSSAAQSSRSAGQIASMQQRAAVQNEIRDTLSSQANQRSQNIASQRQSDRNWWFQVEQQQTAARQPYERGSPALVSAGYGAGPVAGGFEAPAPPSEPVMSVIKWPITLEEQEFASRRALIEAPYRRSPPVLSVPTADDYREMVKTVNEMKAILEWRLTVKSGLPTNEYEQAKAFLAKLGQEAGERAVRAVKSPES